MAILKSVVQVNNGNTGWTKTNVLDALENTFANLGFHGGSQINGVVCCALAPGSDLPHNNNFISNTAWRNCGGGEAGGNASYIGSTYYTYQVTVSGSTYLMQQTATCTEVNYNYTNTFVIDPLAIATGDPIIYNSTATINISGGGSLVNGTTYYVIVDSPGRIKLATSQQNALAGTAINLSNYVYPGSATTTFTIGPLLQNPNLTVRQSDVIIFSINAAGHPLFIQDTAGQYNSTRVLNDTNYRSNTYISYRSTPTNQGVQSGTVIFNTLGWRQGNYYYVSQNNASLTGTITVLPNTYTYLDAFTTEPPYWDYTVPPSGLRSSLQVRVYRYPRNYSYPKAIAGVKVLSINTSGWSTNEVFTIPGNQIGGSTPASDLIFGVNNSTTPSIVTTNLGAGVNFYQKFTNQSKAVLKIVNDANKTYGTTYYGIAFDPNTNYNMMIVSGSSWEHLNWNPSSSSSNNSGRFGGTMGLDYSTSFNTLFTYDTSYSDAQSFATSSTPTAYPLKIVTYRAQAPQDTNFAIIQFVQTINAVDIPYFTFFLHKGTNYGSGIWDLNHVWQGSYSSIYPTTAGRGETIGMTICGPSRYMSSEESNNMYAVRREALYGYFRDATDISEFQATMFIKNNLFSDNIPNSRTTNYSDNQSPATALGYYRNAQYDRVTFYPSNSYSINLNDFQSTYTVSSSANFYKPLKGIPLTSLFAPCPYYLPDDFVAIPFVVSPGLTQFRPGDTITVSESEVYEIITASFSINQTTYDNVTSNTSKGIAFCARTT